MFVFHSINLPALPSIASSLSQVRVDSRVQRSFYLCATTSGRAPQRPREIVIHVQVGRLRGDQGLCGTGGVTHGATAAMICAG